MGKNRGNKEKHTVNLSKLIINFINNINNSFIESIYGEYFNIVISGEDIYSIFIQIFYGRERP